MERLRIKVGVTQTQLVLPILNIGTFNPGQGMTWTCHVSGDFEWYCAEAGVFFDLSNFEIYMASLPYGGYHITLENGMYINCTKLEDVDDVDDISIDGIYKADGTPIGGVSGMNHNNIPKGRSKIFAISARYNNKTWIGIGFFLDGTTIIATPYLCNGEMTDDSLQEPYDDTGLDPDPNGWGTWDRSTDEVGAGDTPSSVMPFGSGVNMYHISNTALHTLENYFWGSNETIMSALWGRFTNHFYNPFSGVMSIHLLPTDFFPTGTSVAGVHVSGTFLPITGDTCNSVNTQFIDASWSMDLPEFYGDYMDYTAVKIVLHIPFCNILTLDPAYCAGGSIEVLYRCDVCTGNVTAFVLATNRDGRTECVSTLGGNCAYSIPVTGHNDGSVEFMGKAAQSIAGGVATAFTGTPMGGAGLPELPKETTQISGNMSGNSAITTNLQLYAEIIYTEPSNPDHYTDLRGRPSDIFGTVGSFTGYTIFSDVRADGIAGATDAEKAEIERLLKEGVII